MGNRDRGVGGDFGDTGLGDWHQRGRRRETGPLPRVISTAGARVHNHLKAGSVRGSPNGLGRNTCLTGPPVMGKAARIGHVDYGLGVQSGARVLDTSVQASK